MAVPLSQKEVPGSSTIATRRYLDVEDVKRALDEYMLVFSADIEGSVNIFDKFEEIFGYRHHPQTGKTTQKEAQELLFNATK